MSVQSPIKAMTVWVVGIALVSIGTLVSGYFLLVPIGWIAMAYGLRYIQLVIIHNASHRNLFKRPTLDFLIGYTVSFLFLFECFNDYFKAHNKNHHGWDVLSTKNDPTIKAQQWLGLTSNKTPRQLYWTLWLSLINPVKHSALLMHRLYTHLQSPRPSYRLAFVSYVVLLMEIMSGMMPISLILTVIVMPLWLMQVSMMMRIASEHLNDDASVPRSQQEAANLTAAIMTGVAPPATNRLIDWIRWSIAMLGNLVARVFILPADAGPAHDWHHYQPRGDWANYIAARRQYQQRLDQQGLEHLLTEHWGFMRHLDIAIRKMSQTHL